MKNILLSLTIMSVTWPAVADSMFSVEVTKGWTEQKTLQEGFREDKPNDANSDTYSVIAGYQFADTWWLEVSYDDYGEGSLNAYNTQYSAESLRRVEEKVSTSAVTLAVKKLLQVNDRVAVYARLGAAHWDVDYDTYYPDVDVHYSYDESGTDVYWGFGGNFKLVSTMYISASYTVTEIKPDFFTRISAKNKPGYHFTKPSSESTNATIRNLSLGLGYQF